MRTPSPRHAWGDAECATHAASACTTYPQDVRTEMYSMQCVHTVSRLIICAHVCAGVLCCGHRCQLA